MWYFEVGRRRLSRELLDSLACIFDQLVNRRDDMFWPDPIERYRKLKVQQRVFHSSSKLNSYAGAKVGSRQEKLRHSIPGVRAPDVIPNRAIRKLACSASS